ncbi:MAG: hypothetical protein M1380_07110 [Chloroflexi bacterium]|nr:hypothetical protein [Chloroflexota bacterium]
MKVIKTTRVVPVLLATLLLALTPLFAYADVGPKNQTSIDDSNLLSAVNSLMKDQVDANHGDFVSTATMDFETLLKGLNLSDLTRGQIISIVARSEDGKQNNSVSNDSKSNKGHDQVSPNKSETSTPTPTTSAEATETTGNGNGNGHGATNLNRETHDPNISTDSDTTTSSATTTDDNDDATPTPTATTGATADNNSSTTATATPTPEHGSASNSVHGKPEGVGNSRDR